jgi:hypothetical protein
MKLDVAVIPDGISFRPLTYIFIRPRYFIGQKEDAKLNGLSLQDKDSHRIDLRILGSTYTRDCFIEQLNLMCCELINTLAGVYFS